MNTLITLALLGLIFLITLIVTGIVEYRDEKNDRPVISRSGQKENLLHTHYNLPVLNCQAFEVLPLAYWPSTTEMDDIICGTFDGVHYLNPKFIKGEDL